MLKYLMTKRYNPSEQNLVSPLSSSVCEVSDIVFGDSDELPGKLKWASCKKGFLFSKW